MEKEYIKIEWDLLKTSVRAELLTKFNPVAVERLKETLPYTSIQSHAVVAGGQMYCPYRLVLGTDECNTENMAEQPIGRGNIELDFQYLSINYGVITEGVPAVAVLQVVKEDVPKLQWIGEQVLDNLFYGTKYMKVMMTYLGREKDA
ncbi:MAG: hypothetical protein HFH03_06155 [Dorea sp.]|nr:hypothetical protein [Dorea sp.]